MRDSGTWVGQAAAPSSLLQDATLTTRIGCPQASRYKSANETGSYHTLGTVASPPSPPSQHGERLMLHIPIFSSLFSHRLLVVGLAAQRLMDPNVMMEAVRAARRMSLL